MPCFSSQRAMGNVRGGTIQQLSVFLTFLFSEAAARPVLSPGLRLICIARGSIRILVAALTAGSSPGCGPLCSPDGAPRWMLLRMPLSLGRA